jgi:hypothetical protein
MRSRFRKKPFVVTLVAAVGCGGGGESGSGATGGDGKDGAACPAAKPATEDACSHPGWECFYPGSQLGGTHCPTLYHATCIEGSWSVVSVPSHGDESCNPPPVYNPCPSDVPSAGNACYTEPDALCEYPSTGACPRSFACTVGEWVEVASAGCEPDCPDAPPSAGSACGPRGPTVCGYDDCGATGTHITTTCTDLAWVVLVQDCAD